MEEKCMGLKNEVALQEKQTGDVDRQLDETTRELHREREKLMAVIRMSGDLIFEYDIVNDKMYYAGPGEGILYSWQITEGYTDQLLKEAGNRTETVNNSWQKHCTVASRIFISNSARPMRRGSPGG